MLRPELVLDEDTNHFVLELDEVEIREDGFVIFKHSVLPEIPTDVNKVIVEYGYESLM